MNYMHEQLEFNTIEEGIANLRKAVEIRDSMSGNMYWSICNDDACEIAGKVLKAGGNYGEIGKILGESNFR